MYLLERFSVITSPLRLNKPLKAISRSAVSGIRAGFVMKVINALVLRIKATFAFTDSVVFLKPVYEQLCSSYLLVSLSATNAVKRVI